MTRRPLHALFLALALTFSWSHAQADDARNSSLEIEGAYAKPSLKGVEVGVAFATISNQSKVEQKLVRVSGSVSKTIEIHTHEMKGGMMSMRQISELPIPPQGRVELKPGSYHLMLIGLKRPLEVGDSFELELHFADGRSRTKTFAVKEN